MSLGQFPGAFLSFDFDHMLQGDIARWHMRLTESPVGVLLLERCRSAAGVLRRRSDFLLRFLEFHIKSGEVVAINGARDGGEDLNSEDEYHFDYSQMVTFGANIALLLGGIYLLLRPRQALRRISALSLFTLLFGLLLDASRPVIALISAVRSEEDIESWRSLLCLGDVVVCALIALGVTTMLRKSLDSLGRSLVLMCAASLAALTFPLLARLVDTTSQCWQQLPFQWLECARCTLVQLQKHSLFMSEFERAESSFLSSVSLPILTLSPLSSLPSKAAVLVPHALAIALVWKLTRRAPGLLMTLWILIALAAGRVYLHVPLLADFGARLEELATATASTLGTGPVGLVWHTMTAMELLESVWTLLVLGLAHSRRKLLWKRFQSLLATLLGALFVATSLSLLANPSFAPDEEDERMRRKFFLANAAAALFCAWLCARVGPPAASSQKHRYVLRSKHKRTLRTVDLDSSIDSNCPSSPD
ncbi:MAG: hypothetical protein MHM6MM_002748 [Cercozoa sp. M6MM]